MKAVKKKNLWRAPYTCPKDERFKIRITLYEKSKIIATVTAANEGFSEYFDQWETELAEDLRLRSEARSRLAKRQEKDLYY